MSDCPRPDGLAGLGLAWLGLLGVRALYDGSEGITYLDLPMMLTGIGIALVSSIVAGLYPTWRVCRMSPAPGSPEEGLSAIARSQVDLVVQDMNFTRDTTSGEEGVALFHEIRRQDPDLPVILLTAWTHLETAVSLVKAGAAIRHSLEGRLTLLLARAILAAVLCGALAVRHVGQLWLGVVLALLIVFPLAVFVLHRLHVSADRVIRAVADGMARLRDKDFSASLASSRGDELGELVAVYNELGDTMRDERQTLYQRELMLDTVIQATPLALVLTSSAGRILYANSAVRQLFSVGRPLEGHRFESLLASAPETFRAAVAGGQDGLFTAELAGEDEAFHLSLRRFVLNVEHVICTNKVDKYLTK